MPALAAIAAGQHQFLAAPVAPFRLGGEVFDTDERVLIQAVVNLSQDSTYRTSIAPDAASAVRKALIAVAEGADVVDLGAESTNERAGRVSADDQLRTLEPVVRELRTAGVVTSVESYYPQVVEQLVAAGAGVINLTGAADDDAMFTIAAEAGAALILCFVPGSDVRQQWALPPGPAGLAEVVAHLRPRLERALELGVTSVAVDPGIGFSYSNLSDPRRRLAAQSQYLLFGGMLRQLGYPVLQSLPNAFSVFQEHYRAAEGYFAFLAMLGRAGLLRVHEVGHVRAVREAMAVEIAATEG